MLQNINFSSLIFKRLNPETQKYIPSSLGPRLSHRNMKPGQDDPRDLYVRCKAAENLSVGKQLLNILEQDGITSGFAIHFLNPKRH